MPKKREEMSGECCKGHKMWKGMKMLVAGLLVLANAYWNFMNLGLLIGLLLVVGGILKLAVPHCNCH